MVILGDFRDEMATWLENHYIFYISFFKLHNFLREKRKRINHEAFVSWQLGLLIHYTIYLKLASQLNELTL